MKIGVMIEVTLVVLTLFTAISCYGAEIVPKSDSKQIHVEISKSGNNRITASPYRIKEIIGDISRYELIHDKSGNVFIIPKVDIGYVIELTVVTTDEKIWDLALEVRNIESKAIILRSEKSSNSLQEQKEQSRMIDMFKSMMSNNEAGYYVQNINRLIPNKSDASVLLTQIKTYRLEHLTGLVISIHNNGTETKLLSEGDFSKLFKGTMGVSIIGGGIMPPGAKGKILIVTLEKNS